MPTVVKSEFTTFVMDADSYPEPQCHHSVSKTIKELLKPLCSIIHSLSVDLHVYTFLTTYIATYTTLFVASSWHSIAKWLCPDAGLSAESSVTAMNPGIIYSSMKKQVTNFTKPPFKPTAGELLKSLIFSEEFFFHTTSYIMFKKVTLC